MAKKQVDPVNSDEAVAELPDPTPVVEDVPAPLPITDEGSTVAWVELGRVLVDLSDPRIKPFALRVAGATFTHVSEDADGRWVYRIDK